MALKYFISVIIAYLIGSIPVSFLAGKFAGGMDLRKEGTGNLGTHNVYFEVGKITGVTVFFIDCLKMTVPLLVCMKLDYSDTGLAMVALGVLAGHNWSAFTGFKGGRGITVLLVALIILLPWESLVFIGFLAFGFFTKTLALYCGFGVAVMPLMAVGFSEPAGLVLFAAGSCLMVFARRLQGSPRVPGANQYPASTRDKILFRLLLDREATSRWSDHPR